MVLIYYWHYIEINIGDFDPIPSTLQSLSIHILASQQQMEYAKGVALGAWDRLPEEVVSIITVKVAKILEAPLKDICTRRLCNKEMKRACSSRVVANRFNLENHYQSMVWGERHWLDADLQTVDWYQQRRSSLRQGDGRHMHRASWWCGTSRKSRRGGRLTTYYVLAVVKYYRYGTIEDVFIHIQCMYGESTFGALVGGRRTEATRRTPYVLSKCTIESRRRLVM
jgi:hypothetical protein